MTIKMARPVVHRDKHERVKPCRQAILCDEDEMPESTELEISGNIRNLSPSLFDLTHLTILLMSDNSLTRLPPEIANLKHLKYLDLSNNKIRQLPQEIGELINLRELHLEFNHLRGLPYELGKLFQLQHLSLENNPLTSELQVIYIEQNGSQRLLAYLQDNLPISTAQPPARPWIPLAKPTESPIANVFTVMCYNVLCEKYATRQLYGYCPNWAMLWDYRKKSIMLEIKNFDSDIISLQEVETDQFYNFFQPELKAVGYEGIFSPKSRAKTMGENERKHVDGCAIFFKTDKFSLVNQTLIEFNQLAMNNADGSENMLNRVMPKDNIALIALLQTKEPDNDDLSTEPKMSSGQPLVVCTAHIHWDPEFCDVKLIQTMMLMNELRRFSDDAAQKFRLVSQGQKADPNLVPLILCGDLNSLPESGVVEYLTNGRISIEHTDFKKLSYNDCLKKISSFTEKNTDYYSHGFNLLKAYKDGVLPFTNYTFDFKGVIDYIFCSRETMSVLGVLGPLDETWLNDNKVVGCPHQFIPSDHFPLVVELEMIPKQLSSGMVAGSGNGSGTGNGNNSNATTNGHRR